MPELLRNSSLLIDGEAQTGHYKPNASGLGDFVVEGKKRYWLHPPSVAAATYGEAGPPSSRSRGTSAFAQGSGGQVGEAGIAIDRFDGTIVGQQLEEVTE